MGELLAHVAEPTVIHYPKSRNAGVERLKQLAGMIVTRPPAPFTRPLDGED